MAEHLGCRTFAVTTTGPDTAAPVQCGHLRGQHKEPGGGPCEVGGCGCPTYTPPEGQRARPGRATPVLGHHVDLVDPDAPEGA